MSRIGDGKDELSSVKKTGESLQTSKTAEQKPAGKGLLASLQGLFSGFSISTFFQGIVLRWSENQTRKQLTKESLDQIETRGVVRKHGRSDMQKFNKTFLEPILSLEPIESVKVFKTFVSTDIGKNYLLDLKDRASSDEEKKAAADELTGLIDCLHSLNIHEMDSDKAEATIKKLFETQLKHPQEISLVYSTVDSAKQLLGSDFSEQDRIDLLGVLMTALIETPETFEEPLTKFSTFLENVSRLANRKELHSKETITEFSLSIGSLMEDFSRIPIMEKIITKLSGLPFK